LRDRTINEKTKFFHGVVSLSTRRQPDDFAQRPLRFEFHEAFQFFYARLAARTAVDKFLVRRILSDMSATILTTRVFTKHFASHKRHAVQVADRGRIIGTWTPASTEPPFVDFEARALRDWGGNRLPVTAAQILKEGKKR